MDSTGLQVLSAMLHEEKVIFAQTQVESKTNEIPIAQKMITNLEAAQGVIFTLDALHTQSETARVIVMDKKAEFVFIAKDNQSELKKNLKITIFPRLSRSLQKIEVTGELRFADYR